MAKNSSAFLKQGGKQNYEISCCFKKPIFRLMHSCALILTILLKA